jgi:predicted ATPase
VNILIGANGTGKTNFADLIDFISRAVRFDLAKAFGDEGGIDDVRTRQASKGIKGQFKIEIEAGEDRSRGIKKLYYSFSLAQSKFLRVHSENLDAVVFKRKAGRPAQEGTPQFDSNQEIQITFNRKQNKIENWDEEKIGQKNPGVYDPAGLVLSGFGRLGNIRTVVEYLGSMRSYNIDATLAKTAVNGGESELERNGRNLILFLRHTLEDPTMAKRLVEDLREVVPYVEDVSPDQVLTYPTLKFVEGDTKLEFRAAQMSDGTIRLLGLLSVMRQPVAPAVVVIEEPENALHRSAVESFLRIARHRTSHERFPVQLFITSHSPFVLDAVMNLEAIESSPTKAFVARRSLKGKSVEEASSEILRDIKANVGKPSDYLLDGSFEDEPTQLELEFP